MGKKEHTDCFNLSEPRPLLLHPSHSHQFKNALTAEDAQLPCADVVELVAEHMLTKSLQRQEDCERAWVADAAQWLNADVAAVEAELTREARAAHRTSKRAEEATAAERAAGTSTSTAGSTVDEMQEEGRTETAAERARELMGVLPAALRALAIEHDRRAAVRSACMKAGVFVGFPAAARDKEMEKRVALLRR